MLADPAKARHDNMPDSQDMVWMLHGACQTEQHLMLVKGIAACQGVVTAQALSHLMLYSLACMCACQAVCPLPLQPR